MSTPLTDLSVKCIGIYTFSQLEIPNKWELNIDNVIFHKFPKKLELHIEKVIFEKFPQTWNCICYKLSQTVTTVTVTVTVTILSQFCHNSLLYNIARELCGTEMYN